MSTAMTTTGAPDIKAEFTFTTNVQEMEASIARANDVAQYAMALERQVSDLRLEKVRALGDGEAFVRWDEKGRAVRAVKTVVPLSVEEGHLYVVQGKVRVTADGYTRLNTFAGVTTVTPDAIIVDDKKRPNPYIERSERNPSVMERIHCRVVALGYSATGNLVALDYRLRFDPTAYFVRDLKTKQRYNPKDILDMLESDFLEEKQAGKRKGWTFYAVAPAGGGDFLGIAVNLMNNDVSKKIGDHIDVVVTAERRAQTICRRNALRHHPAIAVTGVQLAPGTVRTDADGKLVAGRALVPIWGWVQNASMLAEQQEAVRQIAPGASDEIEIIESHRLVENNSTDDDAESDDELTELDIEPVEPAEPPKRRTATANHDDAGPLFAGEEV